MALRRLLPSGVMRRHRPLASARVREKKSNCRPQHHWPNNDNV